MFTRYLLLSASILAVASPALADPAKPAPRETVVDADAPRPAQVVLASAEQVASTAPAEDTQANTPPKRPRAARVTTCRCAGQTSDH